MAAPKSQVGDLDAHAEFRRKPDHLYGDADKACPYRRANRGTVTCFVHLASYTRDQIWRRN